MPFPPERPDGFAEEPVPSTYTVPIRRRFQHRWGRHVLLFLLTLATTTLTGANHYASFLSEFGRKAVSLDWTLLLHGFWYSGTLLTILTAHELGHYLMCRYYQIDASLPYFLPLPPVVFITGTLGAVIRIREPFRTKRELFDVGVAGPIAGVVALIPFFLYGLSVSTVVPVPTEGDLAYLGEPLLFQWVTNWIAGPVPQGYTLNMHPIVFACWFGLLATALNLLPFGQLDGGHIAYATLGDRPARALSAVTALAPIGLVFLSTAWVLPAVLMALMWRMIGLGHPPVLNPYPPLGSARIAVAVFALLIFIVCFTPAPLRFEHVVLQP